MNITAINHIPKSNYAYAYKENEFHIRIRTAKNDLDEVRIIYGPKFDWAGKQEHVMNKIMSDEYFDYYQYNIISDDTRIGYYFRLIEGDKSVLYTDVGLVDYVDDKISHCYYFQYPYINKIDVHKLPSWTRDVVFYQIFVERFFNGNVDNSPANLTQWDADPTPKSFYGGDLEGIIKKLDYIDDLGINGIYLTPIFESPSNHKYDTTDYMNIDNYFGDKDTFKELINKAHDKGIKVVLDAVFNHCGFNFAPFQDVIKNGKKSEYWDWFCIENEPVVINPPNYKTFGFVSSMPKLNTTNPKVKEYLFSVVEYWTKEFKIDGWRLDVSDEIDHCFWRDFRNVVKGINEDVIIIGENWYNAFPWLMGDQFDSVMNYPVTKLALNYFAEESLNAKQFSDRLGGLLMRYPKQVNEALLNLLDSHDAERFLTTCKGNTSKLKNAAAFIFGYIGMPCTYYGTEIGMTGAYDPGCRKGFDWNKENWDLNLYQFYKTLISLRNDEAALKYGEVEFLSTESLFVMKRTWNNESIYVLINQSVEDESFSIASNHMHVKELIYDKELTFVNNAIKVNIPSMDVRFVKVINKL
jgi:glycosidase